MKLPSLELIQSHHSFPGPFVFKVLGQSGVLTESAVVELIKKHSLGARVLTVRESESGKHVAITVEALVNQAVDVLEIFKLLHTAPGLTMIL